MAKKKTNSIDRHQKKVLIDTLKMSDDTARILSSVTKEYARDTLNTKFGMTKESIARLEDAYDTGESL